MAENSIAMNQSGETGWSRFGFWSLIVTQFQVAFSDNALRFLVIFMGRALWPENREAVTDLVGALMAVPFLLFSMAGGFFADRFSKRSVTIAIKVFEISVMLLALTGLALQSLPLTLACVFLMGTHSAFFGPSKYGLLPELLPESKLSWGNGVLEMGTFTAVILGSQAGSWMHPTFHNHPGWPGIILVSLGVAGLITSFGITRVAPANRTKTFRVNFLGDVARQVKLMRQDRVLWLAALGNLYFSFLAMLVSQNLVHYGTETLGVGESQTGVLFASLAIGIGLGSLVAGYLSGGKIEYGLVPLGAIGLTVFSILLSRSGLSYWSTFTQLALMGFAGGFFIVPISAILQHRPEKGNKGAVLACSNWLSFVGIFASTGVHYAMARFEHLTPPTIFLFGGIATLAATLYVTLLLPDSLLRLVLLILTHTIYRIRVEGRENIPEKGGALLVCNHVSIADAVFLIASTDRFIRFLMFKGIYDHPLIKPFARVLHVIPISSDLSPREMLRALHDAGEAIRSGEVVCIFPEGQMSRIGELLPFRRGFERIMKGIDAPIIPVNLDGVWGSIFSFEGGRFLWKLPRITRRPITVSFGNPLPPTATTVEARLAVQQLSTEAWKMHREWMQTFPRSLIHTARRHPFRMAMADGRSGPVSFGSVLTRTIFLARRLRSASRGQDMVGILLPPSVPGALVNYAALLMGKVPVNLNYTLTNDGMASCAAQSGITTVVTSREFLERVKLQAPGRVVFLEEIAAQPRWGEKLLALLIALLPAAAIQRIVGKGKSASLDDLLTVIFSSGSTGDPKGVMLTHYNIASNVEQIEQVFALDEHDRILGILPFFHSFGFTVTLILPAALGVGVVYHPNPLDPAAIGALVRKYSVTMLLATPTFLQTYMRRIQPEDFGSLTLVMSGAERLSERLSLDFEERFGIRPMEGYGSTECSPVIAANRRDFRAAGFRQVGAKRGKIGLPLPGVSVRIVNPETMEAVSANQPGLLLVRGPNVMKGYLGKPEKTSEILRDGWYVTGDIVAMDDDGFLEITDRLSRFSKIGGEMVPHVKVEETLQDILGVAEQSFAVTGVPDGKKGERLVVLCTLKDEQLKDCLQKLSAADLPNLWKPRPNQFFHVDALPYLGTGKIDLRKIRTLAIDFAKES